MRLIQTSYEYVLLHLFIQGPCWMGRRWRSLWPSP